MKRLVLACAASALAFSVLGVASASASTPASNGAATHFTLAYYGVPYPTYFTCSGNRIVSNGGGVKDTETCVVSGGYVADFVAGTYKSDPSIPIPTTGGCAGGAIGLTPFLTAITGSPGFCWYSDYDNALATKWIETYSNNHTSPDTWTESIVAYYN